MEIAPKEAGFDPSRLERVTEHLDRSYIAPGKIAGCQTLVARHGHVAYFKGLGRADRGRGTPVKDGRVFRLFSMTKPITAVALMQLYEQGYFQLNDRVSRVIPEWRDMGVYVSGEGEHIQTRPPKRPMTFAHLLSHQSGLLLRRRTCGSRCGCPIASGRCRLRRRGSPTGPGRHAGRVRPASLRRHPPSRARREVCVFLPR